MDSASVHTYPVSEVCPVCGDAMVVTRLSCASCGSSLEGAFQLAAAQRARALPSRRTSGELAPPSRVDERFGRLARLDDAQLQFVEAFLRCRGVIKNVEDMLGISYPTVKARLASVLESMGFGPDGELPDADRRQTQRDILTDLTAGRITIEEAHRLLGPQSEEQTPSEE